jgi:hypothetical protein
MRSTILCTNLQRVRVRLYSRRKRRSGPDQYGYGLAVRRVRSHSAQI